MTDKPQNPPAFPPNAGWRDDDPDCRGMTLRDYFAGQALCGMLANPEMCLASTNQDDAAMAYEAADAMLAERMKGES